ncbi:MAG: rhomboid family intramembrane serine protease [Terracidiphilus sp.]
MARFGSGSLALPDFTGATRRLILVNLAAYFLLLLLNLAWPSGTAQLIPAFWFDPAVFLHGALWQPLTYSFVHMGILRTLLELLSLWFLSGFIEGFHNSNWVLSLYAVSVLGTALAALALYALGATVAASLVGPTVPLTGSFGGIFGMLVAIGVLYGDVQFMLFPLPIGIKARYLAIIYALVAFAPLFGEGRMVAFSMLGGGLAGMLFVRMAPRRGMTFAFSESWYGLRNRYYRWKRRRAARKFEVYMRRQGRNVRLDGQGRLIDEDNDDKKRWN